MEATQKTSALSVNMTEGSLWKNMLLFSLPLMLTQVLEVLFNLSDVAIAGKFADYRALGAVGSTTLLVSLFTGLLIGMGSGVNVAVARGLGMGDRQRVEKTVHTSFVLCAAIGVVLCLICVLLARPMLALLHTKDELMDGAVLYLKIYALSMPAMAVYNCGNGIMSAVGDTRRPLLYLSVAGVLNVVLNLFFVIRCHMAAEGVAIASVIAQCLSALLIVLHLLRRKACRLELRRLRVHPQEARRVLAIGIPTGLQNAIFAVANLFVQVGLNSFDAVTVSGSSAAANADTLLFNMMAAFYTGCASFVSRNWGAGKTERIVKSYLVSMCYAAGVGALCGILLLFFGRSFLGLFANETEVIDAGMQRLRIMSFSYVVSPLMDASIAASRGIGKSVGPTVIVILGSCVFRVIWVYTVFAWLGTITSLYLLYIFSWAITGAAEIVYFRRSYQKVILAAQSW
jgi:Na+-driven multidrug efflux pump